VRNLLAPSQAIFEVQLDGVFDVRDCLFVGYPLAITALEWGAIDEIAVFITFDNNRKYQALHD